MDMFNYIGGKWLPSSDSAGAEVINPATEAVIGTAPMSTPADADAAVKAAATKGEKARWL